jgi:hypothetical protein
MQPDRNRHNRNRRDVSRSSGFVRNRLKRARGRAIGVSDLAKESAIRH